MYAAPLGPLLTPGLITALRPAWFPGIHQTSVPALLALLPGHYATLVTGAPAPTSDNHILPKAKRQGFRPGALSHLYRF